jgi:uncharacterized membrane-anchored protein YhcB (DUF1043 family)
MADRKKTYALLARLHNRELEVQAKTLTDLQDGMARLEHDRDMLEKHRREGASVTMIEAMPYRGRFLNMMRKESLRITHEIEAVSSKIETQRQRVLGCYQEAKSSETLHDNICAERIASQNAQDQSQLEEQILLRDIRRQL